jgi:hypothetical protein
MIFNKITFKLKFKKNHEFGKKKKTSLPEKWTLKKTFFLKKKKSVLN